MRDLRFAARALGLVLAVLTVGACRGGCARGGPDGGDATESGVAADGALAAFDSRLVAHDCAGLGPQARPCAPDPAPWDALLEAGERLTEVPAMHRPPEGAWWAPLDTALAQASSAPLERMTTSERIALQNTALFLSLEARGKKDDLAARAMALVRRLAFPSATRPQSNEPDVGLDDWLGPRTAWIERSRASVPLLHEILHESTRVVRLVRTPSLRANFSQLVAVDDRGDPFVTSVVGSIEIRRGDARDAAACVILPSAAQLRCARGAGLAAVTDVQSLPNSHFLGHEASGALRCNQCHDTPSSGFDVALGTFDLDAGATADDLAARRALVLDRLRAALAK